MDEHGSGLIMRHASNDHRRLRGNITFSGHVRGFARLLVENRQYEPSTLKNVHYQALFGSFDPTNYQFRAENRSKTAVTEGQK